MRNTFRETATLKGPQYIISSYTSEEPYKGNEAWRLKEKKALDEALGIGHSKRFTLRQLKDIIESLPEKLEKIFNEDDSDGRKGDKCYTCSLERIYDEMFSRYVVVKIDVSCHYLSTKTSCGGYQELFVMIDNESLAGSLSESLHLI